MIIEVDYNPTPSKMFFISVAINRKEAISFDYTSKGHRIIKQVLVENKKFPKNKKISGQWDALIIKNGKLVKKYHVNWIDLDKRDWVNNEIWEIKWEKPISKRISGKLLYYSQLISDDYRKLKSISGEIRELEKMLTIEIRKYL